MKTYRICLETQSWEEAIKISEIFRKLNKGRVLIAEMPEEYESINNIKLEDNLSSD